MTDDDRLRFAKVMKAFGIAYRQPVSDELAEVYFRALCDLTVDAVEATVDPWIAREKFFPSASEIRGLVEGRRDEQGELAWLDVLREIRRVGYMRTPSLPGAALETIEGLWGSWRELCSTLPAEGPEALGWARRFKEAYAATRARRDQGQLGRGEAREVLAGLMREVDARRRLA